MAAVVGILAVMTIKIKTRAQSVHPAHKVLQAHKGLLVRKDLQEISDLEAYKVLQGFKAQRVHKDLQALRDLLAMLVPLVRKVL